MSGPAISGSNGYGILGDTSAGDATSSLRAAALLTLKSKRRKQTSEIPPQTSTQPAPSLSNGRADAGPSKATANDGVSQREEGEISDSENTPPPKVNLVPMQQVAPLDTGPFSYSVESPQIRIKMESPQTSLLDRISDPSSVFPSVGTDEQSAATFFDTDPQLGLSILPSSEYARPGLPMTQEEYDQAKDIVLDVLGWGVPPEFLVDCGLSREIVYYVFTELNLRFPQNLDLEGLPPNPSDKATSPANANESSSGMPGHHALPPKPLSQTNGASSSPLLSRIGPLDTLSRPPLSSNTVDSDLNDIEQQRRQVLLARKAAQASRKQPQALPSEYSEAGPSNRQSPGASFEVQEESDVEPPPTSTESVDDFLNSIGPTSHDPMEVDDEPLDLGVAGSHEIAIKVAENHALQRSVSVSSDLSTSRRGTKRPVAADFVEDEGRPSGLKRIPHPSNGASFTSLRTRSGGNFSSIAMRRCVIDLSDSEEVEDDLLVGSSVPARHVRTPVESRPPSIALPNGANSTVSPVSLVEKEKEINRMRELIAKREQERLKRIATARNTPTPVFDAPVAIKQEAEDTQIPPQNLCMPVVESDGQMQDASDVMEGIISEGQVPTQDEIQELPTIQASDAFEAPVPSVEAVDDPASSAQVRKSPRQERDEEQGNQQDKPPLHRYTSIFDSYPLLRSRYTTFLVSLSPSLSFPVPDLKPLLLGLVSKLSDTDKFTCQYEVPGKGVCRDSGCVDSHLYSRGGSVVGSDGARLEPTDEDSAEYLFRVSPSSWIDQHDISADKILEALREVKTASPNENPVGTRVDFEQRVALALSSFGPPPTQ